SLALNIYPVSGAGEPVSGSILVSKPQLVLGSDVGPYQRVTNAYDVTEEGVPDVWHFLSDNADDDLPLDLEPGEYTRLTVDGRGVLQTDAQYQVTGTENILRPNGTSLSMHYETGGSQLLQNGTF